MRTIGIDLGGTKTLAVLVEDGVLVEKTKRPTPRVGSPDDVLATMAKVAASVDPDATATAMRRRLHFQDACWMELLNHMFTLRSAAMYCCVRLSSVVADLTGLWSQVASLGSQIFGPRFLISGLQSQASGLKLLLRRQLQRNGTSFLKQSSHFSSATRTFGQNGDVHRSASEDCEKIHLL